MFLPARPETVAAFLAAEVESGRRVATLEQRVAAVSRRLLSLVPYDCHDSWSHQQKNAITQPKLVQVQRFSRDLLVGGQLGDLDERHLE
jgi:hypothetical protein